MGVAFFGGNHECGEVMDGHFLTYGRGMFSLLQVLTGDSWSSVVARTAMECKPTVAALYFTSFVLIIAIIIMNVVQAVFLDSYLDAHGKALDFIEERKMRQVFDLFDSDRSGTIT